LKYLTYKSENNTNPLHIIISILISAVVSFFLGWLYSLMTLMPIIYIKFFITIGFGYAIAFTVQIVSKLLKIKDKRAKLIIVSVVLIIAYYSHWISFIIQTYTEGFPPFSSYVKYWFSPNSFFEVIAEINKFGTWSFGSISEVPVNKMLLTLIWVVEAAVIFTIAIAHIFKLPDNPYSEKLNKWYPKMVLVDDFEPIYSSTRFVLNIKEQGIDLILNLATGFPRKYSKISIFYLESESIQYLSIDNVFIETNNNSKKRITQIISPIEISTVDAKKLFAKFKTEKPFFLDFL